MPHIFPSAIELITRLTVPELRALSDLFSRSDAQIHGPQVLARLAQRQKELERDAKQAAERAGTTGQKREGL